MWSEQIRQLLKERKKVTDYHEEEDRRLKMMLKQLDDEEAERLRKLGNDSKFEHFADGNVEVSHFSSVEFDMKCDELFETAPIPFVAKKGDNYQCEKMMERLIEMHHITIPIIHVKGQIYLVGCSKSIIQYTNDNVVLKIGGGYQVFDEYIPAQEKFFQRTLLTHMIKSRESLEWICDCLIHDRRIPSFYNQYEQLDMELDDPSTLKIVRRPTNKKAIVEKRRSSTIGVGKTSLSPVRKSSTTERFSATKFGTQNTTPRKSATHGYETGLANDRNKYVSTDFTENGYVSTSKKRSGSPTKRKYDGPFDPSLSIDNPEYQAKRAQLLAMIQKNWDTKLEQEAIIDEKIDAIRQNAWKTF